ncbi:SusC/RagA family TonB-linked outer membrane protein [Sinomicrobium pectinilyticum]|uniref:SusC/RagA family TonB-linked outer membrane protein n=1 Tax=Sinomicrobium pectinilyticum TaxID=1084421 RepID=A0A3N0CZ87_SINP1|nr:SusC/RagA family TonB-linked outer membrane protein [Sinomicrobium pectinilyticum]RNL68629.1 SusC/RagA family TonB-linked outer membrane protein [Sinomicrobium pectinilyticum]
MKHATLAGFPCWCPITIVLIFLSLPVSLIASPPLQSTAQHQITGTVTDQEGLPLAGVNIIIKDREAGTMSDENGKYTMAVQDTDILIFSFVGFKMQEVAVAGKTDVHVTMQEDIMALEGVEVNAGYYTVKERERTGSISRINAEDIGKQPVSNPLAAMQGRMPGVYIQQNTGVPGGDFNIQIRGRNSIAGGNAPLYVVDGVPFPSEPSSAFGNLITNGGNSLNGLDVNNIASIEVLKDADATAIYGSRGANGVVLITTKKGSAGKASLDLNIQSGTGSVGRFMDLLDTGQYLQMRREAFANDGVEPTPANARDLLLWDTSRYTDWQKKLVGGTSYLTDLRGAVSGGNAQTSFRFGGGYRKETTVFPGDFGYRKLSGFLNLTHRSEDNRFRAEVSVNYAAEDNNLMSRDITSFIFLPPVAPPVYDNNGNLNWGPEGGSFNNPYSILRRTYTTGTDNLIGNVGLDYEFLPGLRAKVGMGYTSIRAKDVQVTPWSSIHPLSLSYEEANSTFGNKNTKTWIVEPRLEYAKTIGRGELRILAGSTFQQTKNESLYVYASGFSSDALLEDVASAGTIRSNSGYSEYNYHAVFGRVNFNWDSRYILNLTGRRDGSSRFGPGKRFAGFGAVGLAWIFSEERFLKNSLLSFGKLRASYGTSGNDQIGDYGYLDTYSSTVPYQDHAGLYPTRLFNPGYGWEVNKKLEIALELGLAHNRVTLSTAWFRNRSSNQLVGLSLPPVTGFSSIQANLPALVQNTGIEIALHTQNIRSEDFSWDTSVNITIPRNKLLEYPGLENSGYTNTYAIGKSLNIRKTFRYTGIEPQTGIYRFEDVNGDGRVSYPDDLQAIKAIEQDFFGGMHNSLSYKGLQLDVFFQFVRQTGNTSLFATRSVPGTSVNQPVEVMERWQQPGDVSNVQPFTQSASSAQTIAFNQSLFYGDNTIGDASFIRLKTVSLSYTVPARYLSGMKARVYVQGQNLLTITGYSGLDPEYSTSMRLPPLQMLTAGVQLTL